MIISNPFLIVNTRDGQNPNVLGANYDNTGNFIPQLAKSENSVIPAELSYYWWRLVQFEPNVFYLSIENDKGDRHYLGVQPAASSQNCSLIKEKSADLINYNCIWTFPFLSDGRIILNHICSGFNGSGNLLSLDTGHFPNVMVYDFNSSVNQTWQFGDRLTDLSPNPPVPNP